MKIVIATPLYPPDIAEPAPYVKELAGRFSKQHDVIVVLFGRLPETVPGVTFMCVDKRQVLPVRLIRYFIALLRATRHANVLYAMNGASVEAPARLVLLVRHIPFFVHYGDHDANEWVEKHRVLRFIKRVAMASATDIIHTLPMQKPEILPFRPKPEAALHAYESAWSEHMAKLLTLFDTEHRHA